MGTLARFDLHKLVVNGRLQHFVETGTGTGAGLNFAAAVRPVFHSLRSCEIEARLAIEVARRYDADPRIQVFCAESAAFLNWVCRVLPHDEPILFWLDAHFPGADYGLRTYSEVHDDAMRLPLEDELRLIMSLRRAGQDIIVADDLRIYLDGPFAGGNLPDDVRPACPTTRTIDFVHQLVDATHNVQEIYEDEGYLLMTPKDHGHAA